MAIIKQYDKRSGITYAYESISYWDKEKKQSRSKRKLIGRIDPETGEIIPTDGRGKKGKKEKAVKAEDEKPDYKALYEKAHKKCMAQETLIEALKKEIKKLQGEE